MTVTLSGPSGASLFYTTDGSDPTPAGPLYAGPFTLSASATVRAASFRVDWTPSPTAAGTYEIKVATPTFDPPGGSYASAQEIAITCSTPQSTITYSTDGHEPTPSDPVLVSGQTVTVDRSMTLRAKAWKAGTTPSDTALAGYTISLPGRRGRGWVPQPGSEGRRDRVGVGIQRRRRARQRHQGPRAACRSR